MRLRSSLLRGAAAIFLAGTLTATALAQDAATLKELKRWHDKVAGSKSAASAEDGARAQALLKEWGLVADRLEPEARGQLQRLEIHASLAVGDAARAGSWLRALQREEADAPDTLWAGWLVATATGDAELAQATLGKLPGAKLASAAAVEKRQRRLRMVGERAPDVTVHADGGETFGLYQRDGVVLVLDFWHLGDKPSGKQSEAFCELRAESERGGKVAFLGINSDPAVGIDAARKFAAASGYTWPQCYEQSERPAPLTDKQFAVDAYPWQVIIDGEGNVRAVGTAGESAFVYSLRAAAAEARGEFPTIRPKTTAGVAAQAPKKPVPEKAVERDRGATPEKETAQEPEPPHNPEAQKLLDQARLFLRTGRKRDAQRVLQELIEKYPDSWEAREARRMGLI